MSESATNFLTCSLRVGELTGIEINLSTGEWLNVVVDEPDHIEALGLVLAGLRRPREGKLLWRGKDIWEDTDKFRKSVRYLSSAQEIFPAFTVAENLSFYTELFGLSGVLRQEAKPDLGTEEIASFLDRPDRFLLKFTTFLLAERPLLICAYPMESVARTKFEKYQRNLRENLKPTQMLITLDTVRHELADSHLECK